MHSKAIAGFEVVALQMLEGPPRLMVLMAGEVNLAVATHDGAVSFHENRRVVAVSVGREFGIPQVETHIEATGLVKQGLRLGAGHLGLVEPVGLSQVVDPPPRKEGCQGEFREHHQFAPGLGSLAEQGDEPLDDHRSGVSQLDGADLGRPYGEGARHRSSDS